MYCYCQGFWGPPLAVIACWVTQNRLIRPFRIPFFNLEAPYVHTPLQSNDEKSWFRFGCDHRRSFFPGRHEFSRNGSADLADAGHSRVRANLSQRRMRHPEVGSSILATLETYWNFVLSILMVAVISSSFTLSAHYQFTAA